MKYHLDDFTIGRRWKNDCRPVIGLDLGSRASKGVLLKGKNIFVTLMATGLYIQETADELIRKLLLLANVERSEIGFITNTGYGRIALSFNDIPSDTVTEISCHAMGAHVLYPQTRTIIDIGGQDSKAIKVDRTNGTVVEFVMNDKCAAGTGQFLEKSAALLGITIDQMGPCALAAQDPVAISSQCVVFAESEIISLRAKGTRINDSAAVANIAAGIHYSAARRVKNLLGRIGREPEFIFTGGVSNNPGMRYALEELIERTFIPTSFDMIYAGALGAAVYAAQNAIQATATASISSEKQKGNIEHIEELIQLEQRAFCDKSDGRKRVGHFCAYTPLEVLNAAGVRHARLFKAGDPETVAAGEYFTQSVFCDFTKSCIGGFAKGDPFYTAVDKLYNFHTCASIKRSSEVIEKFVPIKLLNMPKIRDRKSSRLLFSNEIIELKHDLSQLTGREISDDDIHEQIVRYNAARKIIRNISELRKRDNPPISGREFLELVKAYYYVPLEKLLDAYEKTYRNLSQINDNGFRPLRFMICGSITADGDYHLLDILEQEIGVRVVVEDHCAGLKPFYNTVNEDGDPFWALANGYLDQAPCFRMKTLEDNVNFAGQLAREYRVDGVLYVYLKFCSCYGIAKKPFLDHFQSIGIPVFDLSKDYSGSDYGQIKTRLEAFVEVINARRCQRNEYAYFRQ
ncbi:MAG: 2-hydroxyacyl-CoA dehydratase [Syntrophomonadaceae bacterium]